MIDRLPTAIRILHLEDNLIDHELVKRELQSKGYLLTVILVTNKQSYLEALDRRDFEIILSDYSLPGFDGDNALAEARERCPEIPFIMVTGEIGEDRAIETLHRGAWDYVLKDNLKRLVPAIERGLQEARVLRERNSAEHSLRQSEQRFRQLFEASLAGAYITKPDGTILDCNDAMVRMLGYTTRAEVLGHRAMEFYADPAFRDQLLQQLGKKSRIPSKEALLRRADGTMIHVLGAAVMIIDEVTGEPFIQGVAIDISEQKHAEQALRRSEEQTREILESIQDAFYTVDREWCFTYINRKAEELWKKNREELLGKNIWEVFPQAMQSNAYYELQRSMRERIALHFESISPVLNHWIEVTAYPTNMSGLSVYFRDITERKRADEALHISNRHNAVLFELAANYLRSDRPREYIEDAYRRLSAELDLQVYFHYLYDPARGQLVLSLYGGISAEVARTIARLDVGEAVCGEVARAMQPIVITDVQRSTDPRTQLIRKLGMTAYACHPLLVHGKVLGTLSFGRRGATEFAPAEVSLMRAVADQLAATIQRRRSEERFRRVVESAPNAIVMVDLVGTIVFVNSKTEEYFGYTREELVGASVDVLVPERFRGSHGGFRAGFMGHPETRGMGVGRDLSGRRKDGTEISIEIGLSPIETEDGTMVLASIVDITGRKQAEEALRASEEKFSLTFQKTIYAAALAKFPEAVIIDVNEAFTEIFGYRREDVIGKTSLELGMHTDQKVREEMQAELLATGFVRNKEVTIRRKSGEKRICLNNITRIQYGGGEYLLSTLQDITEQKRAEEEVRLLNRELELRVQDRTMQLEATNRELEAFSYSVSHDLRAPLRAISGYAKILMEDTATTLPEKSQQYLHSIAANAGRMGELINYVLGLARLSNQALRPSVINMQALVEEIIRDLRQGEQIDHGTDVILQTLPPITADPLLMEQVLRNLLSNAFKFSRKVPKPRIEISAVKDRQRREITYSIRDNGTGFDPSQSERLFGVFQRLHSPEEFEGTGIGLANVQRIIVRHGGRVWAESRGEGTGATFFFSVPADSDQLA